MKRVILVSLGLSSLLLVLVSLWLLGDFRRFERIPLDVAAETSIVLNAGATQSALVNGWAASGMLRAPRDRLWLRIFQRLQKIDGVVLAGEYELRPGDTVLTALRRMQRGDVLQRTVTILEGWTLAEAIRMLHEAPYLDKSLPNSNYATVAASLNLNAAHPEGRFLPETYAYIRGTSDLDILRRAAEAMDRALQDVWSRRDADLPLKSPDELLILGSIVEKETGRADERERIAGVFVNRLNRGMRLQTDPTVIYGLGESFDGNLRRRDLRADTPYNTYTRSGLPPTPIALPGLASLRAAAHPAKTQDLYFVARGDGSHQFSTNLADHEKAVDRYQRQ